MLKNEKKGYWNILYSSVISDESADISLNAIYFSSISFYLKMKELCHVYPLLGVSFFSYDL